ncbi:MAG: hypothetical protein LKJ90_08055 [Faecalibacterium sp.]|nr:hypothetical protein [Faecalibacterium sp.]
MAKTLSAGDFTALRLQYKNERAEGEYPAAIEHLFAQGLSLDHYWVTPAPTLMDVPEVQALGEVNGFLFVQQPDGAPWLVRVHEKSMEQNLCFEMPDAEFRAMLQNAGVKLIGEET